MKARKMNLLLHEGRLSLLIISKDMDPMLEILESSKNLLHEPTCSRFEQLIEQPVHVKDTVASS